MPDVYYDSTLTGKELDDALRNIPANVKASQDAAKLSESWAVGGTKTRQGEDTNNAKYWAQQAKTSQTAAAGSAEAAKTSETAAKASQTAAKASETAAKSSQTAAKASETAAAQSKTDAAASATAADGSATNAKASEDAAKASQTAAKTSETAANSAASRAEDAANKAVEIVGFEPTGQIGQVVGFPKENSPKSVDAGGRNYILNSSSEWSEWVDFPTNNSNWFSLIFQCDFSSGIPYTISLEIEYENVTAQETGGTFSYKLFERLDKSWDNQHTIFYSAEVPSDGVHKYVFYMDDKNVIAHNYIEFYISGNYFAGGRFRYRKPKLERGAVATDWAPAPEDLQKKVTGTTGQVVGFDSNGAAEAVGVGGRNLFPNAASLKLQNILAWYNHTYITRDYSMDDVYGAIVHLQASADMPSGTLIGGPYYRFATGGREELKSGIFSAFIKANREQTVSFGISELDSNATVTVTTEWKRFVSSYSLDETPENFIFRLYMQRSEPNDEVWIKGLQFESGNVLTDWTPPVEDMQDKLTGTRGETVGFDADGNAAVVKTGGVNLYTGTKDFSGDAWTSNAGTSALTRFIREPEKYNGLTVLSSKRSWNWPMQTGIMAKAGEVFTFSLFAKKENEADNARVQIGGTNTVEPYKEFTLTAEWERYSRSYTIKEDGEVNISFNLRFDTSGKVYVCGYKLERGGVATDWSPAPEDLQPDLAEELCTVTLENTAVYPDNDSQDSVALTRPRADVHYTVAPHITGVTLPDGSELPADTAGAVGHIVISDKLKNGFKIAYTGAAKAVKMDLTVRGGMTNG